MIMILCESTPDSFAEIVENFVERFECLILK